MKYFDLSLATKVADFIKEEINFERVDKVREYSSQVSKIISDVAVRGDSALVEYAKKFDDLDLNEVGFLSPLNFSGIEEEISVQLRRAIDKSYKNIVDFSLQSLPADWEYSPREGVKLGEKFSALKRVACYIPSGTAPLVSSVLHTAALAKVAGVKEIVLTTLPQKNGLLHPAIRYIAKLLGIKEIYFLGGVYAIAALAYGTESVKRVYKIVGPGNAFVTEAKRQVYGLVDIDMVAGPSELMIIADESANARFIAADLLAQAEHGSGEERIFLVSSSSALLKSVEEEIKKQKISLPRLATIDKVIDRGFYLILVNNKEAAVVCANEIAPEHLQLMAKANDYFLKNITQAGAIFIGSYTPESVGDYLAGPSHVLPTGGTARFFSGLSIRDFFSRRSIIEYSQKALRNDYKDICELARVERLDAHSRSSDIRFKED